MNWQEVGRAAATFAPTLGSILGGVIPIPGASLALPLLGKIIASAYGVPATPEAVKHAIDSNPDAVNIEKLRQATEQARVEVNGFVEAEKAYWDAVKVSVSETAQTMRLELLPDNRHWFFTGWRPFIGWVFGIVALCFGIMLVYVTGKAAAASPDPLTTLNTAWPLFAAYFAVLGAVVAVVVKGRSDEKVAAKQVVGATVVPAKPLTTAKR